MGQTRKQLISENEISEIVELNLGGYRQKICIEGKHKNNPVVICLHGGPGAPIPFNVGSRGMFMDIKEDLTLVCWDQLGCGINNYVIDDSFHIDDFVKMTTELITQIHSRFKNCKILLFGMSWGSLLALKAAASSDYVDAVVCNGQALYSETYNDAVYSALNNSRMSEKNKELLRTIKNEQTADHTKKIMGWVNKYTDGYFCKSKPKSKDKLPLGKLAAGLLTSPDYRLRDLKATLINGYAKNKTLFQEFVREDARFLLESLKVPYTIIQGSKDIVTPTAHVKNFMQSNQNKNIKLIVIDNCGHIPDGRITKTAIAELKRLSKQI